jgi:hypothetical protein
VWVTAAAAMMNMLATLVMAFSMTAPMVAWMRHRHHPWNACLEMTAAMVAPAIPLCALRMADVISDGICGRTAGPAWWRWWA